MKVPASSKRKEKLLQSELLEVHHQNFSSTNDTQTITDEVKNAINSALKAFEGQNAEVLKML